jgi:multiple sugar transport system substrate-binding protein
LAERSRYRKTYAFLILLMPILVACGANSFESPRLATQTAAVALTPTAPSTPHISLVPTPTIDPDFVPRPAGAGELLAGSSDVLTVWINESPDASNERFINTTDEFIDKTGIEVDLFMVAPGLLPELVRTAAISDTLPDIIVHPFEYSPGWVADGILDATAATDALDRLGRETFDPAVLDLLYLDQNETIPAIPSDGWQQLILYRTDWFAEAELEIPNTYGAVYSAAETLFQPDSVVSGIIVPTDSVLLSTQQTFEFIAAANGCELVDDEGKITILHPACLEALEFYRVLINDYSPIGVQTDISSINAYLAGRTGLIIASPASLPTIAGYDESFKPNCPRCSNPGFLAENTGILTELTGSGELAKPANFGAITSLGITSSADRDFADRFVDYWFEDAYSSRIADAPESRVPIRMGTADAPNSFIEAWRESPIGSGDSTLGDVFGEDVTQMLSSGIASSDRWGFPEKQGAIITTVHQELVLPQLLQEMLSGYFTSSQTVIEMYSAIIDELPFYEFPIEIAPTEEP